MRIIVFGNPDLSFESLPLRILPRLEKRFPKADFRVKDPNEEWNLDGDFLILDTVEGIEQTKLFSDLKAFLPAPRLTLHDFDAYANLRFLEKLGKLPKFNILAVPPSFSEDRAFETVSALLEAFM